MSFASPNFNESINVLPSESKVLIKGFHVNKMQANPAFSKTPFFDICWSIITCGKKVELLGIDNDCMLSFVWKGRTSSKCIKKKRKTNASLSNNFSSTKHLYYRILFCSESNIIEMEKYKREPTYIYVEITGNNIITFLKGLSRLLFK